MVFQTFIIQFESRNLTNPENFNHVYCGRTKQIVSLNSRNLFYNLSNFTKIASHEYYWLYIYSIRKCCDTCQYLQLVGLQWLILSYSSLLRLLGQQCTERLCYSSLSCGHSNSRQVWVSVEAESRGEGICLKRAKLDDWA